MLTRTTCSLAAALILATAIGASGLPPPDALAFLRERLPISLACPTFEFEGAAADSADPIRVEGDLASGNPVRTSFKPVPVGAFGTLEVEGFLEWSPREQVLRKWARYRLSPATTRPSPALQAPATALLKTVTLDTLDAGKAGLITRLTREFKPADDPQSRPVFLKGLFVGIEFPIAATRLEGDKAILAHHPGKRLVPGNWYETRKAVYGAAPPGAERAAFERYLSAHRPGRPGLHVNYNSWWTSPVPYTQDDILKIMGAFEEKLSEPFGASFDSFCIDMGWSDPKALWEVHPRMFPEGFTPIQKAAERMNSRLGLWISPSNCYSPASFSTTWAAINGYETFARGTRRFACLAGPRYALAFRERLVETAVRYNVRHFKFDGYLLECPEDHHGHEPGTLSAEPVAEGIIAAFDALHKAAPDAWLETTCFGWNPSPWWLFHANSIIGTFGDDCPCGRVPCPVYRESYTTGRDYYNLQGAARLAAPIWAQEVLGIIHQDNEPFLNDAVMTLMRGHLFLPVYMRPAAMDDGRWKAFAEFLKWARRHAGDLEHTVPIVPASWSSDGTPKLTDDGVMPREPYGYAHCRDGNALIALRNPWIVPRIHRLRLSDFSPRADDAGPEKEFSNAEQPIDPDAPRSVVSLYPELRLYAASVRFNEPFEVPLAPYETIVLSVTAQRPTEDMPRAADRVGRSIEARVPRREVSRLRLEGPAESMGPDWTSPITGPGPITRLDLEAEALIRSPGAELLILLEGQTPPDLPWYRLTLNDIEPTTHVSSSGMGFHATGLPRREHWLFVRAPLASGPNRIRLELWDDRDSPNVSVWIWAHRPGGAASADHPDLLPSPELISLDAFRLADLGDMPFPATRPAAVSRPITRINGIYLDAFEPASASQGYGKLQKNRSVAEHPLTIGARRFARGLGTHSSSRIVYPLDGRYRRFQSWVGADAWTSPSITFEVRLDGRKLWESGLMTRNDPARWVDVDVTGGRALELLVGDGDNGYTSDHADWAEARLLR